MTSSSPGCAAVRAAHEEPLHATAPVAAASWVLVEHPGPWPAKGLPDDLPTEAAAVLERATGLGVRPQLVRRVDERRRGAATVVVGSVRPGATWLERRTVDDLRALADLDLAALAAGTPTGFGERDDTPVVLVCTNGKRDVCCARLGRPLAVLLDRQLPGQVWETNHVGGDRFAPNVVALPSGSYHGAVPLAGVPALADALREGRVLLPHARGRAGLPAAVQAAEHFLRLETGETAVEAVRLAATTPGPGDQTCVELLLGDGRWCVHVTAHTAVQERLTTCSAGGSVTAPVSYRLASLRRLA